MRRPGDKSSCSSRWCLAAMQRGHRHPSRLHRRYCSLSLGRSGFISRRPCPRVRPGGTLPSGHAARRYSSCHWGRDFGPEAPGPACAAHSVVAQCSSHSGSEHRPGRRCSGCCLRMFPGRRPGPVDTGRANGQAGHAVISASWIVETTPSFSSSAQCCCCSRWKRNQAPLEETAP